MRAVLTLVRKELAILGRDRHGLLVLFAMPAVFILIMSLALQNEFREGTSALGYAVLVEGEGEAARTLAESFAAIPGFERASVAGGVDALQAALGDDRLQFVIVIPADFEWPGVAPRPGEVLLELWTAPSVPASVRRLFLLLLGERLASASIGQALAGMGQEAPDMTAWRDAISREIFFDAGTARRAPSAVQQAVPAWLVFAMFFVVIPLSDAFLVERRQATLRRLRMFNTRTWQLVFAKFVPYFGINQLQMLLMLGVGFWLVPWLGGDRLALPASWPGLFLISAATSIAAIGFALLVAAFVRTHVQATTIGGIANVIFGALGGVMVPTFVMPPVMRELSAASPMSWGMEGFLDVMLRQGGWQDALPECAALVAFGVVLAAIATWRLDTAG